MLLTRCTQAHPIHDTLEDESYTPTTQKGGHDDVSYPTPNRTDTNTNAF